MVSSCKFYANGEWMKMYMLIMYIIRMQCDDIMINHHLRVNVAYDFTYATNEISVCSEVQTLSSNNPKVSTFY